MAVMASDSIEGAFIARLSRVERSKRVKMNRAGGKQPVEAGIRPLWGHAN